MWYSLFFFLFLCIPYFANAFCPVCVVGAVAGVGLGRWIGVDDVITGIWVGALLYAVSMLTAKWIARWRWVPTPEFISAAVWYVITLWPLYGLGMAGAHTLLLWGLDRLLVGVFLGTAITWIALLLHGYILHIRGTHLFPYQRVTLTLVFLFVFSLLWYVAFN